MTENIRRYGVRKGAWSEQEDALLRQCIEMYGEGKWHQVPSKSGLNRCRKSCRLRWLNYLKPNIKRGEFSVDEADLMIRLHKLLGNRWSLIAGRLPGRTANDVKNYWNTHLRKKTMLCLQVKNHPPKSHATEDHQTKVIRPRPRTFSKRLVNCMKQKQQVQGLQPFCHNIKNVAVNRGERDNDSSTLVSTDEADDQIQWWKSLLNETEQFTHHEKSMDLASFSSFEDHGYDFARANDNTDDRVDKLCIEYQEMLPGQGDLSFDIELWDFLSDEW